jgi:hypothetical protein
VRGKRKVLAPNDVNNTAEVADLTDLLDRLDQPHRAPPVALAA